jgi:hypothetical protein
MLDRNLPRQVTRLLLLLCGSEPLALYGVADSLPKLDMFTNGRHRGSQPRRPIEVRVNKAETKLTNP